MTTKHLKLAQIIETKILSITTKHLKLAQIIETKIYKYNIQLNI